MAIVVNSKCISNTAAFYLLIYWANKNNNTYIYIYIKHTTLPKIPL